MNNLWFAVYAGVTRRTYFEHSWDFLCESPIVVQAKTAQCAKENAIGRFIQQQPTLANALAENRLEIRVWKIPS